MATWAPRKRFATNALDGDSTAPMNFGKSAQMTRSIVAFALISIAATGQPCNGQLVRIPRTRIAIPVPHTVGNSKTAETETPWYEYVAVVGVISVGLLSFAGIFVLVDRLRNGRGSRAAIRIIAASCW